MSPGPSQRTPPSARQARRRRGRARGKVGPEVLAGPSSERGSSFGAQARRQGGARARSTTRDAGKEWPPSSGRAPGPPPGGLRRPVGHMPHSCGTAPALRRGGCRRGRFGGSGGTGAKASTGHGAGIFSRMAATAAAASSSGGMELGSSPACRGSSSGGSKRNSDGRRRGRRGGVGPPPALPLLGGAAGVRRRRRLGNLILASKFHCVTFAA